MTHVAVTLQKRGGDEWNEGVLGRGGWGRGATCESEAVLIHASRHGGAAAKGARTRHLL